MPAPTVEKASWLGLIAHVIWMVVIAIALLNPTISYVTWVTGTISAGEWSWSTLGWVTGVTLVFGYILLRVYRHVADDGNPRWTYGIGGLLVALLVFGWWHGALVFGTTFEGWQSILHGWLSALFAGVCLGFWSYGPNIFARWRHSEGVAKANVTRGIKRDRARGRRDR